MAMSSTVTGGFSFHRPTQSTPKAMYDASRDKALPPLGDAAGIEQARRKTSETPRNHSHYREEFSNGSWLDSLNDAPMDRVSGGSSLEGMGPFDLERFIVNQGSSAKLITRAPSSPSSHPRPSRRPHVSSAAMASSTALPAAEGWLPNPHDSSPRATSSVSPSSSALASFATASYADQIEASKVGLVHTASDNEGPYDTSPPPFARPPKSGSLPDPSNFPDPYPYGLAHHHATATPALSSAGSASTRSSGYTNAGSTISSSGMSVDYSHVRVMTGEETEGDRMSNGIGLGITTDTVAEMLARASNGSSLSSGSRKSHGAPPLTRNRKLSRSRKSRTTSQVNENTHDSQQHDRVDLPLPLRSQPSYDTSWQIGHDDRDDYGITSEEDVDYGDHQSDIDDGDREEHDQEPTSAAVLADEGRGMIVRGDGIPIAQLNVQSGTTHLLLGGSSTPNAVPTFLLSTLPQVASTLLALDISANYLNSLPPSLSLCVNLEELNISSNPLRVLPTFLACLTSIRVLIADSTGIATIPEALSVMERLHTLSIRRNKMFGLPGWLCRLPSLESLLVDGNPFQGPWKALVEPLLAKTPTTPIYPLSTPMFPQPSASATSTAQGTDTDTSDMEDITGQDDSNSPTRALTVPSTAPPDSHFTSTSNLDDEHTITPAHARLLERSITSPHPQGSSHQYSPHALSRNRTTPSRPFHERVQSSGSVISPEPNNDAMVDTMDQLANHRQKERSEIRRMRSADELRRVMESGNSETSPSSSSSGRPSTAQASALASGSGTRHDGADSMARRFASLGVGSRGQSSSRSLMSYSGWVDGTVEEDADADIDSPPRPVSRPQTATSVFRSEGAPRPLEMRPLTTVKTRDSEKKDGRKWGFLKKMSMGKLKALEGAASGRPSTSQGLAKTPTFSSRQIGIVSASGPIAPPPVQLPPQIGIAVTAASSTPSSSSNGSSSTLPVPASAMPSLAQKQSSDALKVPSSPAAGLLTPHSPGAKAARRRSFLPIDGPPALNIPIPSTAPFLQGITATNGDDHEDLSKSAQPSPVVQTAEEIQRKEEERTREANTRALRSVMAYLRDMNDLTVNQSGTTSVYSNSSSQMERHRRPTISEGSRINSEPSMESIDSSSSAPTTSSSHLRSLDSLSGTRGSSNATMSVATSDSSGSNNEERKQKDDRAKRLNVVREIVETERTYVKQLQELVDIYIQPSCAPVSVLGTSNKDTVIPATERKIVFGGLESLLSFHRDSFLPALERASRTLLAPGASAADADGNLSASVAMEVGRTFLSHAAFMRMYSSYINNYENSLRRVHMWQSERSGTASAAHSAPITPSSSSAQLVNLGLSLSAISTPGAVPDSSAALRAPPLSSSQRKRICRFVKRCRLNPKHSQLNLDGYLLLPVQRIPRYRLLLDELSRITPAPINTYDDPLYRAWQEISALATNMNEEKREAESRNKLVHWQARIKGKFPSPLVQPHRRLIMDGPLLLTRVVRKQSMNFEVLDSHGDATNVSVDCLSPELTPRPLIGILCNDLLVLCRDPSDGRDPNSLVELWAVLRMQTLPQPASIVHGNALRIVDNKAVLYFEAPSTSDALTWFRAINLHIPSSSAKA